MQVVGLGDVRLCQQLHVPAYSQTAFQAALCSLTCRMVSGVSVSDQVTGSNDRQATRLTGGPLVAVV